MFGRTNARGWGEFCGWVVGWSERGSDGILRPRRLSRRGRSAGELGGDVRGGVSGLAGDRASAEQPAERGAPTALHPAVESFWINVKKNLQAGKIRILFAADGVPSELRVVVDFLNKRMDPAKILAIELREFSGQDLRTIVPHVYGRTQEATTRKGSAPGDRGAGVGGAREGGGLKPVLSSLGRIE